jgi:chemotaxis protein MotB
MIDHGKKHDRAGHERWLISYADFITLLFALFVMMYAFSKAEQKKQSMVATAIDNGFRSMSLFGSSNAKGNATEKPEMPESVVMGEIISSPGPVKDDLNRMSRELNESLANQVANHAVSIHMGRDGLVITLSEAGFFDSGSATPKPEALPTLRQIAIELSKSPFDLRVEGDTDNVPIHTAEFDSNWELSTARATHIARLLLEMNAIPAERLSAAGYAEFHPAATNDTAEGRAKNRRVDLVVMPRSEINFAAGAEPLGGPWRRITDGDAPATQPSGFSGSNDRADLLTR